MSKVNLSIVIAMVAGISYGIIYWIFLKFPNWQERSQLGDTFGVVDAIFSGLALIGLIYTISLQRKDLLKQNEAIENSNRLNSLTTLVLIYSADEDKFKGIDEAKAKNAGDKKIETLNQIKEEFIENKEELI